MSSDPEYAYRVACAHWKRCKKCRDAGGEMADAKDMCAAGRALAEIWERAEMRAMPTEETNQP
jgi:hypothetical protein